MSVLKSNVLQSCVLRRCYSYFSSSFNELASQCPPQLERKPIPINNLDFDALAYKDYKNVDLLENLVRLRKQKECSVAPLLPNIVTKRLLDYSGPQEVATILRNPLLYGVFIDEFSGCHLIDIMLHSGNAHEAAQVAAVLIERGLCNNDLVVTLSLQSFYSFLKKYTPNQQDKSEQNAEKEKVRVKFLRNNVKTSDKTDEGILGEAMIALSLDKSIDKLNDAVQNIAFLGFVLNERIDDAQKHLSQHEKVMHKDILQLCQKLIDCSNGENSAILKNKLEETIMKCTQTKTFSDILDLSLKLAVENHETRLISEYEKNFKDWSTHFQNAIEKLSKIQDVNKRLENTKSTLTELHLMRQSLWFFENREDIDIQIYKKQIYYPKRWFGKKKKPKTVDAFYVPPNVSRVN